MTDDKITFYEAEFEIALDGAMMCSSLKAATSAGAAKTWQDEQPARYREARNLKDKVDFDWTIVVRGVIASPSNIEVPAHGWPKTRLKAMLDQGAQHVDKGFFDQLCVRVRSTRDWHRKHTTSATKAMELRPLAAAVPSREA